LQIDFEALKGKRKKKKGISREVPPEHNKKNSMPELVQLIK